MLLPDMDTGNYTFETEHCYVQNKGAGLFPSVGFNYVILITARAALSWMEVG